MQLLSGGLNCENALGSLSSPLSSTITKPLPWVVHGNTAGPHGSTAGREDVTEDLVLFFYLSESPSRQIIKIMPSE